MLEIKIIGEMDNSQDHTFESANRVYDTNGLSPTISTCQGGGLQPKIVASRGRNPNSPTDRTRGTLTEQRLEIQSADVANTLTSVQKDNMLIEPLAEGSYKYMIEEKTEYRVRKLTPKECFRLMGVKDEDYEKLTVSNSQKYKQAGNSIVVDVLMAIFENMFINECESNSLF